MPHALCPSLVANFLEQANQTIKARLGTFLWNHTIEHQGTFCSASNSIPFRIGKYWPVGEAVF